MAHQPIRRVVVATDFSEAAARGVAWAAAIARAHGAKLALVHSVEPPLPAAELAAPPPPQVMADLLAAAQESLQKAAGRLADLTVETQVIEGLAGSAVATFAEETGSDLLVTGTRGKTGLSHLLLGSTAERLVQRAHCPVLAVHPSDADPDHPPQTVLVPTDFSADAEIAFQAADRILHCFDGDATVVLLHVYDLHVEYGAYGTAAAYFEYSDEMATSLSARLEELAARWRRPGLTIQIRLAQGIPSQTIVQEAQTVGADLIAMGTHGRTGFARLLLGSTAERVVQRAPCPVLTVRRG